MTIILSNLNRVKKIFTSRFLSKFAVKWILKSCRNICKVQQDFKIHITANLLKNLKVKIFFNWLRFDRIIVHKWESICVHRNCFLKMKDFSRLCPYRQSHHILLQDLSNAIRGTSVIFCTVSTDTARRAVPRR